MDPPENVKIIFVIPVSTSLCDVPQPDQELVDKYLEMKATFTKRMMNALSKLQANVAPLVEKAGESDQGQAAKDFVEDLQTKPEFQAVVKVAT